MENKIQINDNINDGIHVTMKPNTIYIDLDMVTGLDNCWIDSDVKVVFAQNPLVAISPSEYIGNYTMSVGSLARHLGLQPKKEINKISKWIKILHNITKL